ncbi:hypothetical protein FD755_015373 [Muntiacus reevesi]|uniref:BHLH domain-containing protein n=1 Tax=Muntiacus reevesi TaxID=9886 RepID=A0A5N3XF84_MUNRE|nr:hypothetical protein FD755_015373 [Muntiacus reevesi]
MEYRQGCYIKLELNKIRIHKKMYRRSSSFIPNDQKLEIVEVPINKSLNKQVMAYLYFGMLLIKSNKLLTQQIILDKSQKHDARIRIFNSLSFPVCLNIFLMEEMFNMIFHYKSDICPTDTWKMVASPVDFRRQKGCSLVLSVRASCTPTRTSALGCHQHRHCTWERIKYCCEQLRALLPYIKGRKNDAASVLEATVDYVKFVREKIPPAIMGQITEVLQSNRKFCKKQQMPIQLSVPGTIMGQRGNSVLTSTYSPGTGIRFLTNKHLNVYSVPTSGGALDEAVRGQSSSASENAIGDVYKTRIPSTALSLNSFHAVRYYSKVVPSYDAAAVTNQNTPVHFPTAVPKVSKFLPQHCNSVLGQACTAHPNCLQQFWAY